MEMKTVKCSYFDCEFEKYKPAMEGHWRYRTCYYCQKNGCDSCIFQHSWNNDDDGHWQCDQCQSWKYRRFAQQNVVRDFIRRP